MSYKVPFVDFASEYNAHKREYDSAIRSVIKRGDLILREDLERFEKNLAKFLGVKEVIGVASGTDALILSLKALGIKKGDEVITCSYTFRATIEAIVHAGGKPVLADLGEDWKKYKTARTKFIIPAHLEGEVIDWTPDDDVIMVEDACQAIGAKPLTGTTACYSFYPAKVLGCLGDGGAIATNDKKLAESLRAYRNHDKGTWERVAYNSRLDNLQAAFLDARLKYLPQIIKRRKEIAERYNEGLKIPIPQPREIYQDYIIEVTDPVKLQEYLEKEGIQTMLNGYPFPAKYQKKFQAQYYEEHSLRIPCNETLKDVQVDYVIKKINEYYS